MSELLEEHSGEDGSLSEVIEGEGDKQKEEPEHDEDEVGSMFRKAAKIDKPKCKKYLAKVDCEDLAELLTQPDLFDAAYAFAEKIVEADAEDDDDDD